MPRRPTWRHTTGTKGVNRVTVYERRDRSVLYIEYWDGYGQRIQRAVETPTGKKLPNTEEGRMLAVKVAEALATERERIIYRETAEAFGVAPVRRLGELLAALHDDREPEWSAGYLRDQKRFRKFWEKKLGDVALTAVSASLVNRIAKDSAKRRKWSSRTHGAYLRYIVDAFYYAERQLKWIDARDNLSAVRIPSPRSEGKAYTVDELRALLPALEEVDPRAGWIGYVCWQTGRRLSAVRTLRKRDVLSAAGRAVLRFPRGTDKADRRGEAVVVGRAAELTAAFMEAPGAYVLGSSPPSIDVCQDWLMAAEKAAGVPHRKHRAWHGIKRAFVSAAKDLRTAAKQSGTNQATLSSVYDQDWIDGKGALAEQLEGML